MYQNRIKELRQNYKYISITQIFFTFVRNNYCEVEQVAARLVHTQKVGGSSPSLATKDGDNSQNRLARQGGF